MLLCLMAQRLSARLVNDKNIKRELKQRLGILSKPLSTFKIKTTIPLHTVHQKLMTNVRIPVSNLNR